MRGPSKVILLYVLSVGALGAGALACDPPSTNAPVVPTTPGAKRLFVSEKVVDCEGEGPMKCMQTRSSESEEWSLFYGSIEGFTHDPAFSYELEVEVLPNPNHPQGGSSQRYRLVRIVAKKPAAK